MSDEQGWYLMQQYQEQVEELYGQAELIERLVNEYHRTVETVQEMSDIPSQDTLIPIGGSTFVYGTLKDTGKVLVNAGRGILVEKPVNAAIDTLNKKIEELKKSQESILKTAEEIKGKMDELARKMSEKDVQIPQKED